MHTLDVMTRLMLKDKAFGTELLEIFYNNLIKRSKEHNGPMPNTNIFNIGKDDLIGFVWNEHFNFDKKETNYSFSNFTTRLRITDKKVNPFYLHLILNFLYL